MNQNNVSGLNQNNRFGQLYRCGNVFVVYPLLLVGGTLHFASIYVSGALSIVPAVVEYIGTGNCTNTKYFMNGVLDADRIIHNKLFPDNKIGFRNLL